VNTGLGLNMAVTVFLGCLVGIVIVAQTLYGSTMEHIKEFGTVKAIGGSNADIYSILTKQASIAAIAGYIVGAAMAHGLGPAMAKADLKLLISNELSVMVFVGALAVNHYNYRTTKDIDLAIAAPLDEQKLVRLGYTRWSESKGGSWLSPRGIKVDFYTKDVGRIPVT